MPQGIGGKGKKSPPVSKELEAEALKTWEQTMHLAKEEVRRNRAAEGRGKKK